MSHLSEMLNFKLELAFDGTRYHGWQRQSRNVDTVQAKLEQLLSRFCGTPLQLIGCGRTDAGVHAESYIANFHAPKRFSAEELWQGLDHYLPEDIIVRDLQPCAPRFHARFHTRSKLYTYRLDRGRRPNPFNLKYRLHVPEPLDLDVMRQAALLLCGEHNFRCFTTQREHDKSLRRTISEITFLEKPQELWLCFRGDGFLWNMVRIMAGALLEIGRDPNFGRLERLRLLLESEKREQAADVLPAKALFLQEVQY